MLSLATSTVATCLSVSSVFHCADVTTCTDQSEIWRGREDRFVRQAISESESDISPPEFSGVRSHRAVSADSFTTIATA